VTGRVLSRILGVSGSHTVGKPARVEDGVTERDFRQLDEKTLASASLEFPAATGTKPGDDIARRARG
jgi:hypothetical protein